jgi:uncharacterized Zn finger protein (UPF0148 family)
VPTHRPTGDAPAAAVGELAQRWATEREMPAGPPAASEQPCPGCGAPLVWESGHTLLICPKCNGSSLPASIGRRYAQLEVKDAGPTRIERARQYHAEVTRRMEFAQKKDKSIRAIQRWIDFVDPDRLPEDSHLIDTAIQLHSNLNHLIREIRNASTLDEFAVVNSINIDLCKSVVAWKSQFQEEHERAEREDDSEDIDDDDEYDDAEYSEPEPEPVVDWQAPRTVYPPGATPGTVAQQQWRAQQQPAPSAVSGVLALAQNAAIKRAVRPDCQFDHFWPKAATARLDASQWQNGPNAPGVDPVYCCAKHRQQGLDWVALRGYGWVNITELESTNV